MPKVKKLLLSTKEVEELLSCSAESFKKFQYFPQPVVIVMNDGRNRWEFPRNLYSAKEVYRWAKKAGIK